MRACLWEMPSRCGHVVNEFWGLPENLTTLTRNTVQLAGEAATFQQLSVPTALYRETFELLQDEIKPKPETAI